MPGKQRIPIVAGVYTYPGAHRQKEAISGTWLHGDNVFFVYGNDGGEVPRKEGNSVYLPCEESYERLPNKTIAFLSYVQEHFDYDTVLIFDDDVLLCNPEAFFRQLASADYCGYTVTAQHGDWHKEKVRHPENHEHLYQGAWPSKWASGHAYGLSKKAVEFILAEDVTKLEDLFLPVGYEDVMIGKILLPHAENITMKFYNFPQLGRVIHPVNHVWMGKLFVLQKILPYWLVNAAYSITRRTFSEVRKLFGYSRYEHGFRRPL